MDRPGSLAAITMRSCRPPAIATARAPCASRCDRRNPSTPDATVPIARLGPSACFWAWAHTLATASDGSERNGSHPYPHIRSAATNNGLASAPAAWREFPDKPLQRGEFVSLGALVRAPHGHRQVVPSQRVTDRCARRIRVDGLVRGQHLPNPHGSKTVLVLQPAFPLVLIDRDDLLRDPVDVFEQRAGDRLDDGVPHRFGDIDRAHLGENDLVHLALTETIGADQRVHRDTVLGEPARILQCRRWRLHPLHGDVVAQCVQKGFDVSLDAGAEQFHDSRIAPQFGDVVLQRTLNARRNHSAAGRAAGRRFRRRSGSRRRHRPDAGWSPHDSRSSRGR